jgi:hypothetical protein
MRASKGFEKSLVLHVLQPFKEKIVNHEVFRIIFQQLWRTIFNSNWNLGKNIFGAF